MKTISYYIFIALIAFSLQSCDKEDDLHAVPAALEEAFSTKFPNSGYVEWEKQKDFYVAEFHNENNQEAHAWFTLAYQWDMTETDILFSQLPQAVQNAFNQCEYANWQVDDIDCIEKPENITFYVIEVEHGNKEKRISIDSEGQLL